VSNCYSVIVSLQGIVYSVVDPFAGLVALEPAPPKFYTFINFFAATLLPLRGLLEVLR
jgi:hypothetical protein